MQAEVLGYVQQALSSTLAVCPIICKAGGANECRYAQFPAKFLVLLAPTLQQQAHCILVGGTALLRGVGDSFPAQISGLQGFTEGFKLLTPADVHNPPESSREDCSLQGSRAEIPLHTPFPKPDPQPGIKPCRLLRWEGDHTHLEQNPRVHSQFPFISLLLGCRR